MVGQALALLREHVDVAKVEVGVVVIVGVCVVKQLQALEIRYASCVSQQLGQDWGSKGWVTEGPQVANGLGACLVLVSCQQRDPIRILDGNTDGVARYSLQNSAEVVSNRLMAL